MSLALIFFVGGSICRGSDGGGTKDLSHARQALSHWTSFMLLILVAFPFYMWCCRSQRAFKWSTLDHTAWKQQTREFLLMVSGFKTCLFSPASGPLRNLMLVDPWRAFLTDTLTQLVMAQESWLKEAMLCLCTSHLHQRTSMANTSLLTLRTDVLTPKHLKESNCRRKDNLLYYFSHLFMA